MASENGTTKVSPSAEGLSSGTVEPQIFPATLEGKLQTFSQRRWIGLSQGWTRIGAGTTELDSRQSSSQTLGEEMKVSPHEQARAVRALIAQLCESFFHQGWAPGTGGGVSIRVPHPQTKTWRVFVAPSGLQKEDMIGDDIFELDMDCKVVVAPKTPNLRLSACTSLWYIVYKMRPTATCVIHTHSMNAQLATLLDASETSKVLRITHLEMLKGVGNHAYDDALEIPIIDNRPSEDLLGDQLEAALRQYPKANAVLVRRHGIYAWGDSWEQAKTQYESFDYLCQSAVEMKRMGLDPGQAPTQGSFRVDKGEPPKKRPKLGFNGVSATKNEADLQSSLIPLVPRDKGIKAIVLDIEGCTTSISFVHDTLFPYARQQLEAHLAKVTPTGSDAYSALAKALAADVAQHLPESKVSHDDVVAMVTALMDGDIKSASLKKLQGDIWKAGYASGELQGHVYDDFVPMLNWMKKFAIPVYIYSSGSVAAQKLLFGNSTEGNLLDQLQGHFDITTSGPKKEDASYSKIAKALSLDHSEILFCSDSEAEIVAANKAGLEVCVTIRPGNAPLGQISTPFPRIHSLLQICCST